ncbi:MAG: TetR/AcrR family transcriptional regulator, partial [Hyphomonas sp.]
MSKSKTAAKRESRVAEILDCAEIHFVEKGFHGAGISGIAKECGISVGHLYHYFASKDLLIEAVVERELLRQKDRMEDFRNLSGTEIRDQIAPLVID